MTTEPFVQPSAIRLLSVYGRHECGRLLYELLSERTADVNISHRAMPSFEDHAAFINSMPYEAWYFICDPEPVGSVYLSKQNEIGVFIFQKYQKQGYARRAVMALMEKHGKRRYLANINPANAGSRFLFTGLGFNLIQHTYAL